MQIRVENLSKKFGDAVVLDDLSFSVSSGEVIGFLGPNGAGKTTTMRIITGFLAPSSGTIKIGDTEIKDDPLSARKKIGYLPENNPLYLDQRVYEYLGYIADAKNIDNKTQEIKKVLEMCGLTERISQPISELSKGYKQRVGLAQALLGNPEILILDEPTSGLDPNQIVEIRNLIKEVGRKKTIILSTHILGEVHSTCSKALIINRGKIVASGTTDELLAQAKGKTFIHTIIIGDKEHVQEKIKAIPSVEGIHEETAKHNGEVAYLIESNDTSDTRKEIFNTCVHSGFTLLEMERKQKSLEDVFAELTK